MRILITNDDGIHAAGLEALERIARALSNDLWIVAPELEQSGASRALTLSEPLRVRQIDSRRFAISGTPTDCVTLAIQEIIEGERPALVLSGVNRGQNIAEDVTMSGTVAGAIEGMALGVPAIALSQAMTFGPGGQSSFAAAEAFGAGVVARLLEVGWPRDVVINLNFPARPPDQVHAVEVVSQGVRAVSSHAVERRTDLRGRAYYWLGYRPQSGKPKAGTDLRAIHDGRISVTPLHIDLTHRPTLKTLKAVLGGPPPKPPEAKPAA